MEDAKISNLNVESNGKKYTVFGVFDGHGGISLTTQGSRFQSS